MTSSACFSNLGGKYPLSSKTGSDKPVGLHTVSTIRGDFRIVFRSSVTQHGHDLIEIVAVERRRENLVHDAIGALVVSGTLSVSLEHSIFDLLKVFEDTAERYGLEQWDYRPEPAPKSQVREVVDSGILPKNLAQRLSSDEIIVAMENAYDPDTGEVDQQRAVDAALDRVATSNTPDKLLEVLPEPRCGAYLVRAKAPCIRRRGHTGAHRATP